MPTRLPLSARLPGEVVLQKLQPARTAAGHPFFEIVFGFAFDASTFEIWLKSLL